LDNLSCVDTVQIGLDGIYARLGAPAGASIAADIAANASILAGWVTNGIGLSTSAITAIWSAATATLGGYAATTIGYVLAQLTAVKIGYIDAAISGRMATFTYTTPPTAGQNATALLTDLMASADFNTASSLGALLKANLDTNVGSRMATFTYTAPSNTDIATIKAALPAGAATLAAQTDVTNVPSAILATKPDGANTINGILTSLVTTNASVATLLSNWTAALATHLGSLYTALTGWTAGQVTGYASAQDPVTLMNAGTGRVAKLDNVDVAVSSRLATSGYTVPTTPPTTAQIATAILTDLMAGTDFNTVGSLGALVKMNLNAPISSIPTTAPPTVIAIRQEMDTNSTRLAHLQADIPSTPLAASNYTAPDNTEIQAIKAVIPTTVMASQSDVDGAAISINAHTDSAVSDINTSGLAQASDMLAVKAKTDLLPSNPASTTDVNTAQQSTAIIYAMITIAAISGLATEAQSVAAKAELDAILAKVNTL
jgi:hypothetical protein